MEMSPVWLKEEDVERVLRTLEGIEEMLKVLDGAGKIHCSDIVLAAQEAQLILRKAYPAPFPPLFWDSVPARESSK